MSIETAPSIPPPLDAGMLLADDVTVVEHVSRNQVMDVYDVWDERRCCRCVAKTLRPELEASGRDRVRLAREGRLLADFTHPHIVRAYETQECPRLFVLLEALSGETLSHLIERRARRMPVAELAILGLQIASATRYLHAAGWLHLDLKPSNVIIDAGGSTKLIDLSLVHEPGHHRPGIGTRPYLAPEQAAGGELTAAADVWGLGGVLFEAACGQPPFETSEVILYPQLTDRAGPIRARRRLPAGMAELIDGCLEREPARRPSFDDLLTGLDPHAG